MRSTRGGALTGGVLVLLLAVTACGGGGPSEEEQAREAEWAWLNETKQELDAKRGQVSDLRQQIAEQAAIEDEAVTEEEAEGEAMEGEGLEAAVPLEQQLAALEEEVEQMTEEFGDRLVAYLNADPMIEGEEPTQRQIELLHMKSDEDIILAQEWIDRGGDYKRAIEIYNTALMFDPDNQKLKQALADAEANRYMSEERFSQVKNDMTEDEVRSLLGQVNLHNVREYPDKEVMAWFYPSGEDGSAAAVWFRADKSGTRRVYQAKFDAVSSPQGDEE
jgi:hypothetical protein